MTTLPSMSPRAARLVELSYKPAHAETVEWRTLLFDLTDEEGAAMPRCLWPGFKTARALLHSEDPYVWVDPMPWRPA